MRAENNVYVHGKGDPQSQQPLSACLGISALSPHSSLQHALVERCHCRGLVSLQRTARNPGNKQLSSVRSKGRWRCKAVLWHGFYTQLHAEQPAVIGNIGSYFAHFSIKPVFCCSVPFDLKSKASLLHWLLFPCPFSPSLSLFPDTGTTLCWSLASYFISLFGSLRPPSSSNLAPELHLCSWRQQPQTQSLNDLPY